MMMNNFRDTILKRTETRVHKVNNSLGMVQAFNYYKKKSGNKNITYTIYSRIVNRIHQALIKEFLKGKELVFPCKMGKLELRKLKPYIEIKEGKVKTNLPIDWDRTLKLWEEDEESRNNKTLVRKEYKDIYSIYYNKKNANYINKVFYKFTPNRLLKHAVRDRIEDNSIDAFNLTSNE